MPRAVQPPVQDGVRGRVTPGDVLGRARVRDTRIRQPIERRRPVRVGVRREAPGDHVVGVRLSDLADEGINVTLVEARPRLGGATWSLDRDGLHLDNGQHVFMRCCTSYIAFLERLGVTDRTELQPRLSVPIASPDGRRARLARNGLPAPLHLAGSLLTFPFLGPVERVRAGTCSWDGVLTAAALASFTQDQDALDDRIRGLL